MENTDLHSPLWTPRESTTAINDFRNRINSSKKYGVQLDNYWDLHNWSTQFYPEFWEEFLDFSHILHSKSYTQIVDRTQRIDEIPEWFTGARLNYAENLLRFKDDRVALYLAAENTDERRKVTYSELYDKVAVFASAMRKSGICKGDRVVGYLPNVEDALEAFLAAASLGAIWSCSSPDFGVTAILDRFRQIQPKILFSVDSVIYNGKKYNHLDKVQQVVLGLPALEKVVIVPLNSQELTSVSDIPKSVYLEEFLESGKEADGSVVSLEFEQVPFKHPLNILYSSGTTGVPKCMVHSVGGTLIQHLKEHLLHGNMSRDDVIMYYTTTGWMMWNWLVSSLAVGATVVLYNGSPFLPHKSSMWDLVDELNITIFGTSAKWLAVCEDMEVKPGETHSLKSLHTILSTGSPLTPKSYDYVYRDIKHDVLLGSITGGSDIISCFAGQNPTLPVHRGEIQSQNLAMAMECWDQSGKPVLGEKGEMVCTKPFPSMPTEFWNDPDGKKYQQAYFNRFPGVWSHSDFLLINPVTKGIIMLGRSDGTLNPNGIRFGSSEIYNVVDPFKEIQDSICVSQMCNGGDERVVLFLKLADGHSLTKELVDRVKSAIRQELSARHVPAVILETKDIPYTLNGKKVEIAVKKIISGEKESYREALSNPESLDLYRDIPELQRF